MRAPAIAALVLLGLPAAGCGPVQPGPPKARFALEGSLTVMMELGFDQAHVDVTADFLAVRFVRTKGEGEDTHLKVTAHIADLILVENGTIDLAEEEAAGTQRGVISRDVLDDPRRLFPRLQRGRLILDEVPNTGKTVHGDLAITFENGIEFASGRTVFGKFEADVL
ncbi:MAG: hypothetical protein ACYC8T_10515 [Myxococcaceae bacterium]